MDNVIRRTSADYVAIPKATLDLAKNALRRDFLDRGMTIRGEILEEIVTSTKDITEFMRDMGIVSNSGDN